MATPSWQVTGQYYETCSCDFVCPCVPGQLAVMPTKGDCTVAMAFQIERGGQWSKGKSAETFNPAGPWLVTPDEIDNVLELGMWLDVSGVRRQTGSTSTMIFDPYFIVHYLSQFMVLYPGDVINTGTPAGVALGQPEPKPYLRAGDVVELEIDGLGRQRQELKGA